MSNVSNLLHNFILFFIFLLGVGLNLPLCKNLSKILQTQVTSSPYLAFLCRVTQALIAYFFIVKSFNIGRVY